MYKKVHLLTDLPLSVSELTWVFVHAHAGIDPRYKTASEQVRARTSEGKATSDLPRSQNSQRKAAGSCQATLSLSQQEVESKRTLITFCSISQASRRYNAPVRQMFYNHVRTHGFVPVFSERVCIQWRKCENECDICLSLSPTYEEVFSPNLLWRMYRVLGGFIRHRVRLKQIMRDICCSWLHPVCLFHLPKHILSSLCNSVTLGCLTQVTDRNKTDNVC